MNTAARNKFEVKSRNSWEKRREDPKGKTKERMNISTRIPITSTAIM
jgi:hypothetical protein